MEHLGSTVEPPDLDYVAWVEVLGDSSCIDLDDPDNILTWMPPGTPVDDTEQYMYNDVDPESFDDERAWLLAPTGDLTVFRPNTPPFQVTKVPDEFEETSNDPTVHPGAGVRFNGDDDNGNGVPDHTESPVANEDDLVRLEVDADPAFLPDSHEWFLRRSNAAIKLWRTPTKRFTELFGNDDTAPVDSLAWFIEWVDPNTNAATLEFGVREVGGAEVCVLDTIALYRFRSIVTALGGLNQVPADPVNDPGNQGAFQLAIDLYQQGYDVYMYGEEIVANDGTGPPYDEIVAAVQTRQVQNVGIYGYSYGGGVLYFLATRLASPPTIVPNFACYIDAVTNGGIGQENRRPPGVAYHLSLYQPEGLNGGPIEDPQPGDEEFDVVAAWGLNVNHYTIDDHPQVILTVENRLKQHVPSP